MIFFRTGLFYGIISFCLLIFCARSYSQPLAALKSNSSGVEIIEFSPALKSYLKENFPQYHFPTQQEKEKSEDWRYAINTEHREPVSVLGDFDGNGLGDVALLLLGPADSGIFLVLNSEKNSKIHSFILTNVENEIYRYGIEKVKKGHKILPLNTHGDPYDQKGIVPVTLKNEGIRFIRYESASAIYYWKNSNFIELGESD